MAIHVQHALSSSLTQRSSKWREPHVRQIQKELSRTNNQSRRILMKTIFLGTERAQTASKCTALLPPTETLTSPTRCPTLRQ